MSKAPPEVFISYSVDARPWAEKLSQFLEEKGVSTWTDFKSIRPGQRWLTEIERALDDAQCFLIVVGPKNIMGEWQEREWQGALQHIWTHPKKRIIPVLIDEAVPPSFLSNWGFIRTQPGTRDSWMDRVFDAVRGAGRSPSAKASAKPNKALSTRFKTIKGAAERLKSSRES